jgi:hypothetical protein
MSRMHEMLLQDRRLEHVKGFVDNYSVSGVEDR